MDSSDLSPVEHAELVAYRAEFPLVQQSTYLNSCSIGALSLRSLSGLPEFLLWNQWERWLDALDRARRQFAALIGAQVHEIALAVNVSAALSSIASALDYTSRPRVVMSDLEFPTMQYQWLVKERQGVQCQIVHSPDRVSVPPELFAAACDERTSLLATSRAYYTSGALQNPGQLAEIAHRQGAYLLIDDYQATGQIPLDVKAHNIDLLVSGSLKWLLGGPGVAFIYAREELLPVLSPTIAGWFAHAEQFQFLDQTFAFRADARRFEMGTPAMASVYAALGGLEIIAEIGVSAIAERTRFLVADLLARIKGQGWHARVAPEPEQRSAIVMLEVAAAQEVVQALRAQHILVDSYDNLIRIAPSFYNTIEENALIVHAIAEILAQHRERTA